MVHNVYIVAGLTDTVTDTIDINMKFTDKQIKALKPKDKPYIVSAETDSRGVGRLQIKVYPTGTKKFLIQYFFEQSKKRLEFGIYGAMTLAEARKRFNELSTEVQNGENPKDKIKQTPGEKPEAQKTFINMVHDFYLFIDGNWAPNTISRVKNNFNNDLLPYIKPDLLPAEFTEHQAREVIYTVYNRGAKEQANIFRSNLLSLFKFAIDFDNSPEQFNQKNQYHIKINPIRDIAFKTPKNVGNRWLDESEIYNLWHTNTLPHKTKLYYRLSLCLAGQRVIEVYHSKKYEFDLNEKIFTIPTERIKIKTRGDHHVPISTLAEPIIKELILLRGSNDQLWQHRDRPNECAHISTLRMATLRWVDLNDLEKFTPRDLRRTCKTLMGKAGITKEDRDLLQQHSKRDVSTTHYDRYDYMKEKRAAMETWTKYLQTIINKKGNN